MCVCVCVVYIHTYINTYIHTFIRTYVRTYMHTCTYAYIHTNIYTYIRVCVCVRARACIYKQLLSTCLYLITTCQFITKTNTKQDVLRSLGSLPQRVHARVTRPRVMHTLVRPLHTNRGRDNSH